MTENDIKFIEKAIEIRNKGMFVNSTELTDVYNRVLNKHRTPTSCGSCLRMMVNELEVALKAYKQALEALKEKEVDNASTEENKASGDENKPKKGRPKKS